MWLISYFMKKPASSLLKARILPEIDRATSLHDERLLSYFEAVNYLLTTYTTDDPTAHTIKELELYKQVPGISPASYAKRLYTKALRCGIVSKEKVLKSLFVEILVESVCDNMRVYLGQHSHAPLKDLARYVDTLIKIADRNVKNKLVVEGQNDSFHCKAY